jgi:hypothetical protein
MPSAPPDVPGAHERAAAGAPSGDAAKAAARAAADDLRRLLDRVDALAAGASPAALGRPPSRGGWSAAECLEHLSATAEEGSRLLLSAPQRAGRRVRGARPRWWIRLFVRSQEPPARFRVRTRAQFVPTEQIDAAAALERFRVSHAALADHVQAIAPADLHRTCIPSPFGPLVYTPLEWALVLAAHGRRHLWQAEQALVR